MGQTWADPPDYTIPEDPDEAETALLEQDAPADAFEDDEWLHEMANMLRGQHIETVWASEAYL